MSGEGQRGSPAVRFAVAAGLGILAGSAAPLGGTAPPGGDPEPGARPETVVPAIRRAVAPAPAPWCPPEELDAARARAEQLEGALEAHLEDFERGWGRPVWAPAGWDPAREEERLEAVVEQLGAIYYGVECEPYPCRVLRVGEEAHEPEELAAAYGVAVDTVQVVTSMTGGEVLYGERIVLHAGSLDAAEQRYVDGLAERTFDSTMHAWLKAELEARFGAE